jgi:hypothetical protein
MGNIIDTIEALMFLIAGFICIYIIEPIFKIINAPFRCIFIPIIFVLGYGEKYLEQLDYNEKVQYMWIDDKLVPFFKSANCSLVAADKDLNIEYQWNNGQILSYKREDGKLIRCEAHLPE